MTNDITNFSNILQTFNIYSENLVKDFRYLLISESSPESYFELIAAGAFKECYKLTDNYIIKFATEENNSEEEIYILNAAEKAGLAAVFLPTKFMLLESCTLPSYYTSDSDSYIYETGPEGTTIRRGPLPQSLDSLFIQPYAEKIATDVPSSTMTRFNYRNTPIYNKNDEMLPYEIFDSLNIFHRIWLEDAFNFYGLDFLKKLGDFIQEYNIYDLHNANIGWINNRPIILDWLSN